MKSTYLALCFILLHPLLFAQVHPNVIILYTDDLGYGDLSCYGATKIATPHIDALAKNGIRFTNGHATSATCTPSRYALLTGEYPWRKKGTQILPGDAALIIPPGKTTLASLFKETGYATGIIGKWHLGLGNSVEKNWNASLKPGPNEVGFDYSFIFPATADRVPTVFVENNLVVAADTLDPIVVNYTKQVGNDPTVISHPQLVKMKSVDGHAGTIVNGIGRIGYMSGGKNARWTDEEMPLTFLNKATAFIAEHRNTPFFLMYAFTEPHVPRMPSTVFKGKSGLGFRGDAILQLDWAVGELVSALQKQGLLENTIIIFSSDNGPVLNDGYADDAVEMLNGHTPAGILRGGKYSTFEAGTRVPFIISWPKKIKPAVSNALVSQIDLLASFAHYFSKSPAALQGKDSENVWETLMGKNKNGRTVFIEQGIQSLAIVRNNWKYIEPNKGAAISATTQVELGNSLDEQLYDLENDPSEKINLAKQYPDILRELKALLQKIRR